MIFEGGEFLTCKDFRHIYDRHFPQLEDNEINYQNWVDFETCVGYTVDSREGLFIPKKENSYGRTRYNNSSGRRSYVVLRNSNTTEKYDDGTDAEPNSIVTAYTDTDGGRDWGGCRKGLSY